MRIYDSVGRPVEHVDFSPDLIKWLGLRPHARICQLFEQVEPHHFEPMLRIEDFSESRPTDVAQVLTDAMARRQEDQGYTVSYLVRLYDTDGRGRRRELRTTLGRGAARGDGCLTRAEWDLLSALAQRAERHVSAHVEDADVSDSPRREMVKHFGYAAEDSACFADGYDVTTGLGPGVVDWGEAPVGGSTMLIGPRQGVVEVTITTPNPVTTAAPKELVPIWVEAHLRQDAEDMLGMSGFTTYDAPAAPVDGGAQLEMAAAATELLAHVGRLTLTPFAIHMDLPPRTALRVDAPGTMILSIGDARRLAQALELWCEAEEEDIARRWQLTETES